MFNTPHVILNIQLCSATLTELCLEGLHLSGMLDRSSFVHPPHAPRHDLKVTAYLRHVLSWLVLGAFIDGVGRCASQDIICQCKQLTLLHICCEYRKHFRLPPDGSDLLLFDFPAALPKLATLLWRRSAYEPAVRHAQRQFFADFAGSRAAERLPGTGLRLLHAEHCVFERALELKASQQPLPASLPASLQILSLVNLGRGQQLEPVEGEGWVDVGHPIRREATWNLLEPCTALRELYILGTRFWNTSACNFLDLPRIATSCPVLQVLVLHAVMDTGQEVRPTPADLSLASLLPSFAVWLDVVPRGCAGRSIWQRRVCAARTGSPRDHQVQHGA